MRSCTTPFPSFVATLIAAALTTTIVSTAHAQTLYLTSGSYTENASPSSYEFIYAGMSNNGQTSSNGIPYTATLNVTSSGSVNTAVAYNTSTMNISGGTNYTEVNNASVLNINGGNATRTRGNDTSTLNIVDGVVGFAFGFNTSRLNISGGSVALAYGYDNSSWNISGGSVTLGFVLGGTTANVNFVGADLSYVYSGYGRYDANDRYADLFKVSGVIGGAAKTTNIYIENAEGRGGVANSTPRQFTFNGVAPVAVPEAGTLAFVLPALALVGGFVLTRRSFGTHRRK